MKIDAPARLLVAALGVASAALSACGSGGASPAEDSAETVVDGDVGPLAAFLRALDEDYE